MTTKTSSRILLILPSILFCSSVLLTNAEGPYYFFDNFEDYAYLFNSLNLLTFHVPGHTDHPGTTLQVLGAFVLLGKWLLASSLGVWTSLQTAVLSQPESFIHAINRVVNLAVCTTAYFAARRLYAISGSLPMALTLQASLLLFQQTLLAQARVQNEPLLMAAGLALAVPLARALLANDSEGEESLIHAPVIAGAFFAFGVISKITFVTLLPFTWVFRQRKSRLLFVLSGMASAAILLVPALPALPRMIQWFASLLVHTGRYGRGDVGLIQKAAFVPNLKQLIQHEPTLFVLLFYYLAVLAVLWLWNVKYKGLTAIKTVVASGCIAILVQILIVVRQGPTAHYLIPALIAAVLVNTMLVGAMAVGKWPRALNIVLLTPLAIITCWAIPYNGSRMSTWIRVQDAYRQDVRLLSARRQETPDCTYIGYFRSSLPTFALGYGDDFSAGQQRSLLAELYPKALNLNIFSGQLRSFSRQVQVAEVRRWVTEGRCVMMQGAAPGTPYSMGTQADDLMIGMILEPVLIAGPEGLYKLTLRQGEQPGELVDAPEFPAGSIILEAEEFSSGNVLVDRTHYGLGIGVITSSSLIPGYVEYKIRVPHAGRYAFLLRYASAESRALRFLLNNMLVSRLAASESTNGYDPKDQLWQKIGVFDFVAGLNTLRMETDRVFPHLDKLGLIPVAEPTPALRQER